MTDQGIEHLVRDAFQETGLIISSTDAAAGAKLPPSSARFLQYDGLPKGRIAGFEFNAVQQLPVVRGLDRTEPLGGARARVEEARCVGEAYGVLMVIEPVKSWSVWMVDPTTDGQDMFVNSRVELLGACLAEYALLRRQYGNQYGASIAEDLKLRLQRVDEPAIDGWWGTVIQEVEFGLM